MSWGISDKATEKEKIFAEFNDSIYGMNCVGKIDYAAYGQIYGFGRTLADREYAQGKADERIEFAEWILQKDIHASTMSIKDLARFYVEEYENDLFKRRVKEKEQR